MNRLRMTTYCLATVMALGILIAMIHAQRVQSSNDASRWDTIWSLTHGQGYVIDESPYWTIDKIKRNGHFYSSKPPLMPTLVAGIAEGMSVSFGLSLPGDGTVVIRLILFLWNVIPLALLVIFYGRLLEEWGYSYSTSRYCLLAATCGTYLTAYSMTLNNHTVAACAAFCTLFCLIRIHYQGRTERLLFALAGLAAAWTVANELPAAPFGLIVFLWLLRVHWRRTLVYFVPCAGVVLVAYFMTSWVAAGSLIPNYIRFHSPIYMYESSYWQKPTGIDAASDPKWFYLFNLLIGHHGILSLTPVLAIALIGQLTDKALKRIHQLGLFLLCALLGLYVVKSNNYGGICQGPRWFFWLIPFWLIALPIGVQGCEHRRPLKIMAYGLLVISAISVILAMVGGPGPWTTSWLELLMHKEKWISY